LLAEPTSPFRIETGNATMNAMLLLGFLALLPLSVGSTIVLIPFPHQDDLTI
jgi:hypothetical protein